MSTSIEASVGRGEETIKAPMQWRKSNLEERCRRNLSICDMKIEREILQVEERSRAEDWRPRRCEEEMGLWRISQTEFL